MTQYEIGKRIRQLREQKEWSQDELATRLGYKSRSSVNKIELGERNLTQSKIKQIADALNTTPAYIMGWADPLDLADPDRLAKMITTDPVLTDHVQKLQSLKRTHQEQVYDLIDILHRRELSDSD